MRVSILLSIVLFAGCAQSPRGAEPSQTNPVVPTATPPRQSPIAEPPPTAAGDEALVCEALAALQTAHNDHVSQLVRVHPLESPEGKADILAVSEVFLNYGMRLDSAVLPEAPELVVSLKNAYIAYGQGVAAMGELTTGNGDESDDLLAALRMFNAGLDDLQEAEHQLDLARASGAVICP